MTRVAAFINTNRQEAIDLAGGLIDWIESAGHSCVLIGDSARAVNREDLAISEEEVDDSIDLAITLGGDGSILFMVRAVGDYGIPVMGINLGRMGYLSEVEPGLAQNRIQEFFEGRYSIEERMRLEILIDGETNPLRGLNEAVIEKVDIGRTVRLGLDINGDFFTSYATDGLIIATPTGSTAYSLSARGPIIDPMHRALLLTPVAPHSLFDRAVVLSPDDHLRIQVLPDCDASIALDGQIVNQLEVGQSLLCTAAKKPARLVSFGGSNFHRVLKAKFGLSDR
ncbi:MAG: NAD(+)/NADH kinase [Actinomycetota bacterium]|nr:NAD(+)/NADH kinase [Actinomycetota bacterium]